MRYAFAMACFAATLSLAACTETDRPMSARDKAWQSLHAWPYSDSGDISTLGPQIGPCMAPLRGEGVVVAVRLVISRDGFVKNAVIEDGQGEGQADPAYAEMAASILRAVNDPHCQPFHLRDDLYDFWKQPLLSFRKNDGRPSISAN
ncbi:MAG TPA: hypothetical protein VGO34_07715 [Alphaproteobacteria bacterium]|jgi:hypothetical protein